MKMKKIAALILALVMILSCIPAVSASTETEIVTSGKVKSSTGTMEWTFQDGVLTIIGNDTSVTEEPVPWAHLNNKVRHLVFDGSLSLITSQFSGFPLLESVTWPENVINLNVAFNNCYNLRQITIPNTVKKTKVLSTTVSIFLPLSYLMNCSGLGARLLEAAVWRKYLFPAN